MHRLGTRHQQQGGDCRRQPPRLQQAGRLVQQAEALVVLEEVQQPAGGLLAEVEADQAAAPAGRDHDAVVRPEESLHARMGNLHPIQLPGTEDEADASSKASERAPGT